MAAVDWFPTRQACSLVSSTLPKPTAPELTKPPSAKLAFSFILQTRVDEVNLDNSAAMQVLFNTPGWAKELRLVGRMRDEKEDE